ncbi:FTR1 family iron permease [Vibrio salinus]|uniref:FTR1 family iron permease n=1 Tax=Vibrio salinus TaxID=2899784 RepID=UPI001E49FC44|nr:FTR1 family protein [Vibrio salinus]MCE0495694.1 FTR1 family iron permease [Vibrio salinus]
MQKLFQSLLTFLICLSSFHALGAIVDYQAAANDINQRLDKTLQLYQAGDIDSAKSTVQMAYFDIYEGIEGPIRINYSQKYSYQLEAKFGEIRKLISQKVPQEKIKAEIDWLKGQINTLPEKLASGHQLVAENQDLNKADILPYWRNNVISIEKTLNDALSDYRESADDPGSSVDKKQKAYQLVQKAQYEFYKNSELEIAIRLNRSMEKSAQYNDRFKNMAKITRAPYSQQQLIAFSYELSTLVQDLKDDLPGLPATRDSQKPQQAASQDAQNNGKDWATVVNKINDAISESIEKYKNGNVKAAIGSVQDAYFDLFEASGMENAVGAHDSAMKTQLEGYFTHLVSLMKAGADVQEMNNQREALHSDLTQSSDLLSENNHGLWAMLLASLTIILREGLEALLIVAAITSYLVKNNFQDKLYIIKNSVVVGLIASVITAGLFQWLFTNSGASRELLEGFTMLIAVVVLFSMSYWLLSKVEAHQWKKYLENKISLSLTTGSIIGLWFASFLAVYREGAETVLFYYALGADADTQGLIGIFTGLVIGILLLVIIFYLMRHSVVKLPLKPFFLFTGGFMYLMAFVFAGKGILELVEGKLFQPTLITWAPQFSLLGIYPYIETLTPQIILVIAAVFALFVMKRRGAQETATAV